MPSDKSVLSLLASAAVEETETNMCQENSSMEILETQERKMNKNKEKKRGLTHFLGHYQQQTHQYLYSPHHLKKEGCNDA